MAGPQGSKYYNIFLKQKLQLVNSDDNIVISEEGFELLSEIITGQSIVAASKKMGISYRKAWGLLRQIEAVLGFHLILKHRGGKEGGKTFLTPEGIELTSAYSELKYNADIAVHDTVKTFFRSINSIQTSK